MRSGVLRRCNATRCSTRDVQEYTYHPYNVTRKNKMPSTTTGETGEAGMEDLFRGAYSRRWSSNLAHAEWSSPRPFSLPHIFRWSSRSPFLGCRGNHLAHWGLSLRVGAFIFSDHHSGNDSQPLNGPRGALFLDPILGNILARFRRLSYPQLPTCLLNPFHRLRPRPTALCPMKNSKGFIRMAYAFLIVFGQPWSGRMVPPLASFVRPRPDSSTLSSTWMNISTLPPPSLDRWWACSKMPAFEFVSLAWLNL
jgi:hypothetical protein